MQFLEKISGVYLEVVYDNMKNVVSRFIGRNEKELNPNLIQLATYYGFHINVTNCVSGNEKGTIESRVKHVRQSCFTKKYQFKSLEEAVKYNHEVVPFSIDINKNNADNNFVSKCGHTFHPLLLNRG